MAIGAAIGGIIGGALAHKMVDAFGDILTKWIEERMYEKENRDIAAENATYYAQLVATSIQQSNTQMQAMLDQFAQQIARLQGAQASKSEPLDLNRELQRALATKQIQEMLAQAQSPNMGSERTTSYLTHKFRLEHWPLRAEPRQILEIYGQQIANENGILFLVSSCADGTVKTVAEEEAMRRSLEQRLDEAIFQYNLIVSGKARSIGIERSLITYPSGIFEHHEAGQWQARLLHHYLSPIPTVWMHVRVTATEPIVTLSWWGTSQQAPEYRNYSLRALGITEVARDTDLAFMLTTPALMFLDALALTERQGQIGLPNMLDTADMDVSANVEQIYRELIRRVARRYEGVLEPEIVMPTPIAPSNGKPLPVLPVETSEERSIAPLPTRHTARVEVEYFSFGDYGFNIGQLERDGDGSSFLTIYSADNLPLLHVVRFSPTFPNDPPELATVALDDHTRSPSLEISWIEQAIVVCFPTFVSNFVALPWNHIHPVARCVLEAVQRQRVDRENIRFDALCSDWLDKFTWS